MYTYSLIAYVHVSLTQHSTSTFCDMSVKKLSLLTLFLFDLYIFIDVIHSVCVTCSTGVFSLYRCQLQPQRDCPVSPHLNPMVSVNQSC